MSVSAEKIDIDAVSAGPKLDKVVAELVMRWKPITLNGTILQWRVPWEADDGRNVQALTIFPFSTDERYAAQVEAEIERRELSFDYTKALFYEVVKEDYMTYEGMTGIELFQLITATPEQRCRAAYRAVAG